MSKKLMALATLSMFTVTIAGCGDEPTPFVPPDPPGQTMASPLDRDMNPDVDEATRAQLSADNGEFAFALFHQTRETMGESHNTFFSPHSISIALAMTYAGASGQTYEQMGEVLRFRLVEEELHPAFNALDLDLGTRGEADVDNPPVLRVVNHNWAQEGEEFFDDFLEVLAVHYGAGLQMVDFRESPDAVRQEINGFISEMTQGRINELLGPGTVSSNTRLVLTNAIYFLADWHFSFDESDTSTRPFFRADGESVDVDMMRNRANYGFFVDERTHAAVLDYAGRDLAFVAMKPANAAELDDWLEDLDAAHFHHVVSETGRERGTVRLPRFQIDGDYDVKGLFAAMGWTVFNELDRMSSLMLSIAEIIHKSFILVDEEGTEAAAATGVVIVEDNDAPEPGISMTFNRPFVYAIYDKPTETILFLGALMDP